jgi:uncharacterized protein (TIGR04255 family)
MDKQQSKFPHLQNAPIVEAIIDFRVRLSAGFEIKRFKELQAQFQAEYPYTEEQKAVKHEFQHAPGKLPSHCVKDLGTLGYMFRSTDNKNIVQFRRDGFTFNRLTPYTSWDQVFPEASRFWSLYVQSAEPEEIKRIAVRYINRLPLPAHQFAFPDFLTAPPPLPQDVPRCISSFISRVIIQDPETKTCANVTQALEPPLDERYIPVILDIDVFQQNLADSTAATVLPKFAELRAMKNRIFFGSLTKKAIDLFL